MTIHKALFRYHMTDEQKDIVSHEHGPLLVIAGPGSGKTHSLTLLAMNLLLKQCATPSQLILCTYTEKSAFEIRDRLTQTAHDVRLRQDLSQMRIDTIHGICTSIIAEYVQDTPLGNSYDTLDQFPQQLLIYEHLEEFCNVATLAVFQERWGSRWKIVKGLQFCFDRIIDELITDDLRNAYPFTNGQYSEEESIFLRCLVRTHIAYQKMLANTHRTDFAHLQKIAYNLLVDPITAPQITNGIRYVLVDEYQDTNYIQEQILIKLASATGNLCVVGDEDQALYRFRGATVQNILEFTKTCAAHKQFSPCKTVRLTTNYRSHPNIIKHCNEWMDSTNWHNPHGTAFRTHKTIRPFVNKNYLDPIYKAYPAVLTIHEESVDREAEHFAELVSFLKEKGIISDYNEVALLLHSVKPYLSTPYIDALQQKNIPVFCPRSRTYFEQDEVRLMMGCFAYLFGYNEKADDEELEDETITYYMRNCQKQLEGVCCALPTLTQELAIIDEHISHQTNVESVAIDCFYRLLAIDPFRTAMQDQFKRDALIEFSQMLGTFQQCYRTSNTLTPSQMQYKFFHTFFRLRYSDGVNQRENPQQSIPTGHVQIMTVHQAKGLEFPVVVFGRLDKQPPRSENMDKELKRFYHRQPPFEPEDRIPRLDLWRNYYVAFSRAEHILVLTAVKQPNKYIADIFGKLPDYSFQREALLKFTPTEKTLHQQAKQRYSFTQAIRTYETCPRRYEYFHEYNFQPSHTDEYFVGQLVHQTIENIHRKVCAGQNATLNPDTLARIFEKVATCLEQKSRTFKLDDKKKAFEQVLNYCQQNQREILSVEKAEIPLSIEKDGYILTGKIDLLRRVDGELHMLDFKTGQKQFCSPEQLEVYERQLCTYAHIIEQRGEEVPKRLFIYWTGEEHKQDALMEITYHPEETMLAGQHFDTIVANIDRRAFTSTPNVKVCTTCDLRTICRKDGTL